MVCPADLIPAEAGLREETFHGKDFTAFFLPKEIYFQRGTRSLGQSGHGGAFGLASSAFDSLRPNAASIERPNGPSAGLSATRSFRPAGIMFGPSLKARSGLRVGLDEHAVGPRRHRATGQHRREFALAARAVATARRAIAPNGWRRRSPGSQTARMIGIERMSATRLW